MWDDDAKQFWLNGKRHREDGPAVIYPDGSMEWWFEGEFVYYAAVPIEEYMVIQDGYPCDIKWMGRLISQRKILTATGIKYLPDLPGL